MKTLLIILIILAHFSCFSQSNVKSKSFSPISIDYRDKIVKAIYIAEGGANTKWQYGIKSVKTNNPKKVCENTVANNYIRWQKAGKTNDFIEFLGARFCPVGAKDDPTNLNKNWARNVKNLLAKQK